MIVVDLLLAGHICTSTARGVIRVYRDESMAIHRHTMVLYCSKGRELAHCLSFWSRPSGFWLWAPSWVMREPLRVSSSGLLCNITNIATFHNENGLQTDICNGHTRFALREKRPNRIAGECRNCRRRAFPCHLGQTCCATALGGYISGKDRGSDLGGHANEHDAC